MADLDAVHVLKIGQLDVSSLWQYYDVRHLGTLDVVESPSWQAAFARMQANAASTQPRPAWGPDAPGWTAVDTHQPEQFFDVLMLPHQTGPAATLPTAQGGWACAGLHLQDQKHYSCCHRTTTNKGQSKSLDLGYYPEDLLGRGEAGGLAEGRIVRLLSLVRKCIMGVWHPPVQFRSKSDRAQAPQTQAICTISFCGHNNRALKCPLQRDHSSGLGTASSQHSGSSASGVEPGSTTSPISAPTAAAAITEVLAARPTSWHFTESPFLRTALPLPFPPAATSQALPGSQLPLLLGQGSEIDCPGPKRMRLDTGNAAAQPLAQPPQEPPGPSNPQQPLSDALSSARNSHHIPGQALSSAPQTSAQSSGRAQLPAASTTGQPPSIELDDIHITDVEDLLNSSTLFGLGPQRPSWVLGAASEAEPLLGPAQGLEPQHEAEPREHPDQQQQSLVPCPPISQPAQPPLVPCSAGSASGSLPRSLSLRAASYPSELSPLAFACGDDARPPPAVTPGSCASDGEQGRAGWTALGSLTSLAVLQALGQRGPEDCSKCSSVLTDRVHGNLSADVLVGNLSERISSYVSLGARLSW